MEVNFLLLRYTDMHLPLCYYSLYLYLRSVSYTHLLGYAFTDPVDWQIDAVQTGEGTSHNLGGGASSKEKDIAQKAKFFDKASSSFSGGLSIVTTTSGEQYNFCLLYTSYVPST